MSNDNIQRLRDKRKSLEQSYGHSPKRKGGEAVDVSSSGNSIPDYINGGESGSVSSGRYLRTSHVGIEPTKTENKRSSTNSAAFSTSVLEHIQYLEMKVKDLEAMESRLKSIEAKAVVKDDSPKYPTDSYSLIAMNGPKFTLLWYELWSTQRSFYFFLFGMLVWLFQIALYGTMLFGETDTRWGTVLNSGNPDAEDNFFAALIPPNTNGYVKAAQVVSLLVYVIFPDSTLKDLLGAYRFFPRCSCSNKNDDPIWMMRFACVLKGSQALFGIATVWLLTLTSTSVIEIILNFTAVNFISNIDDRAYSLGKDGVFGGFLKQEVSENIGSTNLPATMQRKNDGGYCIVLTSAGVVLIGFLIAMMNAQNSPDRWVTQSSQITFSNEGFTSFSGCYILNNESDNFNRYTYDGANASLSYCGKRQKWYLLEIDGGTISDPCEAWFDVGIASSSETSSFDVSASFSDTWTSRDGEPLTVTFDGDCLIEDSFDATAVGTSSVESFVGESYTGVPANSICDENTNTPEYQYDGGDCCAATCEGPRCGVLFIDALGNADTSVEGYPHCKDPDALGFGLVDSVDTSSAGPGTLPRGVPGNSICDENTNTPEYQYDGGDCCEATCEGPRCGKIVIDAALGAENSSVDGYPNCKDPNARRLTSRFDSSRRRLGASRAI